MLLNIPIYVWAVLVVTSLAIGQETGVVWGGAFFLFMVLFAYFLNWWVPLTLRESDEKSLGRIIREQAKTWENKFEDWQTMYLWNDREFYIYNKITKRGFYIPDHSRVIMGFGDFAYQEELYVVRRIGERWYGIDTKGMKCELIALLRDCSYWKKWEG